MEMYKVPYGISNYKKIKTRNFLYVDKTRYIEELEKLNTEYPIFLRPRRFGKSLLVSTLFYYYDRNSAGQFTELFGDTYIGAHKTELANQYYVLRFDFSGLNTENAEQLKQSFYRKTLGALKKFLRYYHMDVEIAENEQYDAASMLDAFLTDIVPETDENVFVMIDEYDQFANNIIGNQEFFQSITGRAGFVRNFYEVIKEYAGSGCIDRIFITGVTSMTLDSLTSGFNIAKNISMMAQLNEMVGFTEEETRKLLSLLRVSEIEQIMKLLVEQYNGYLFHYEASDKHRVLNSNLLMYFLDEYQRQGVIPKVLIDSNIRTDYDKLTDIFAMYKDVKSRTEILQTTMVGESVEANLVTNFSFTSSFSRDEFLSMLFYRGLLTIEGAGALFDVALRAPNEVIREVYYSYYANYLKIDDSVKKNAWESIAYEDDFVPFNSR